ncbi:MAG: mandelate racemase [Clostridia bacterium]|nr:mandelate racemase [Clostridia bacterium]
MNYNEILSEHKIVRVVTRRARTRYPRLYGKNSRLPEHRYGREFKILEIYTDKGAYAWSEGWCKEDQKDLLLNKKVSEVFDVYKGSLTPVKHMHAFDSALHSLAGVILGIPVVDILCLGRDIKPAEKIDCYDGAIYMNDISPDSRPGGIEAIIRDCQYDWDVCGFRSFKVKVGRGGMWMEHDEGLRRDIEVMHAIKKNFPTARLLVDANDAFSLEDCEKFMEACKDLNIYWLEEPFLESVEGFSRLREILAKHSPSTLIADGEFRPDIDLIHELCQKKLIDVVLMDTVEFGLTHWRAIMPRLKEYGVFGSPHNWPLKVKTHMSAHLAAAFPDLIPTIEGVPDETEGVEFDNYIIKDGFINLPRDPGFGMNLIWAELIEEFKI